MLHATCTEHKPETPSVSTDQYNRKYLHSAQHMEVHGFKYTTLYLYAQNKEKYTFCHINSTLS